MKKFDLRDSFSVEGTDLNDFYEWIKIIVGCTSVVQMETEKIRLLPVIEECVLADVLPKYLTSSSTNPMEGQQRKLYMTEMKKNQIFNTTPPPLITVSLDQILKRGGSEEIFNEARTQSKLFIAYNNKLYFTSTSLYESLCARVNFKGDATRDTSIEKIAFIMRRFSRNPQTVKALVRTFPHDGISKIMIIGSSRYQYVPQSFFNKLIPDICASLGERPQCYHWAINSFVSTVNLEFPMLGKRLQQKFALQDFFVPGICLISSDTHDASISARPTWRIGESIVIGKPLYMKHMPNADLQGFFSEIKNNILMKYSDFYLRLSRFKNIVVENPVSILPRLYSILGIDHAVGKRMHDKVLKEQTQKYVDQEVCSAYDLVVGILKLPGDYPLEGSPADKFKRAVYEALFLNSNHFQSQKKPYKNVERAG